MKPVRKFKKLLIALFFLAAISPAFAQVRVTDLTEESSVGDISYYRTDNVAATIEEISAGDFKPLDVRGSSSLGFDPAAHWFRFAISNQSTQGHWLLEVGYAPLDRVDLYYRDSSGHWMHQYGGDRFPLSDRKYKNRHPIFDLNLSHGRTETFYLKVVSKSSIQVPLTLWRPARFQTNNYEMQFGHGIFYGIIIIMTFYNLFLFLSIKDRTTLYYIATLLSGANVIAFFQGYGFYYIYPEHPEWGDVFSALSSPFFIVSSIALTRSFLQLRVFSFYLDRLLVATAVVSVLSGLGILIMEDALSYVSLHVLIIVDFIFILLSALYCFLKNYRPARYFLLAWISLLIVGALFSLRNMGYIQGNWFTNNALYFGGIMQTMLISFALGDRINLLKRENERSKQRELEREQEAKERLEKEVKSRTEEIRLQKDQLEESNQIKDKLFSIISHDLKGPLNSLKGTLNIWQLGVLKPEELKGLTQNIGEQLHQTSEFLDNLLQWAKSQMQGEVVRPERIELQDFFRASTDLLLPEFAKKDIELRTKVAVDCFAFADPTMTDTVIRNLVSNALKFTLPGGYVEIQAVEANDKVFISVKDTGVGISPSAMQKIFTLHNVTTSGTREEKGTGIGLVLCKEFVEKNGGEIEVESEEGKGSTFRFTLPSINGKT